MDYKILEEANRMCGSFKDCSLCPAYENLHANCIYRKGYFDNFDPAKAAAIIEKWAAEHPVKTYADVFFEAFPNALRCDDGVTPQVSLCDIWEKFQEVNCTWGCAECWQQPYPERSEGK